MSSTVGNENDVKEYMEHRQTLWKKYNSTCRVEFFGCPRGCISLGQHVEHDSSDILSLFSCPSCLKNWVVCRSCNRSRKAFDDTTKLKRHMTNFHKDVTHLDGKTIRKLFQCNATMINVETEFDTALASFENICHDIEEEATINIDVNDFPSLKELKLSIKPEKIVAFNATNLHFFEKNLHGFGGSYLIGKSQFHLDNMTTELPPTEVCLHLRVAKFCLNSTKLLISQLGDIIEDILSSIGKEEDEVNEQSIWKTCPPTCYEEIRRTTIKGKHSVFENLPQAVGNIINNHAYFSIIGILEVFLGLDFECLYLPPYTKFQQWYSNEVGNNVNLNDIHAAKELEKRLLQNGGSRLHLSAAIWHDDLDPSGSNKNNKNKVWILTFTFRKKKDQHHNSDNTFVVSLGKKGDDHDVIFEQVKKDIEIINGDDKWFYCKQLGGNIQVHIDISIDLADSPEYHDCNCISRGNSTYTSLRGWISDMSSVWDKFKACDECYEAMRRGDLNWEKRCCMNCVNWDISNDQFGLMMFRPPKSYPKSSPFIDSNGNLKPNRITNEYLMNVSDIAHKNVSNGIWSVQEGSVFLSVHGIQKHKADEIMKNARNMLLLGKVISEDVDENDYIDVMNAYDTDSTDFDKFKYPATWGHPYLPNCQIVAPMHTIALCMEKNTVMLTLEFASLRNKKTTFLKKMNEAFDVISDMKLDWCKVFPVESDKFGGWVSENWCSLGRIMKWIYSTLDHLIVTEEYTEPEEDVRLWSTKECDAYLKYYGLKVDGNAKARRDYVSEIHKDDAVIKLSPEERYGSVLQVQKVIESLSSVLSHVMSLYVDNKIIYQSDRHIRMFLYHLEHLDTVINKGRKKSKLQSSYSFLASLQLVNVMKEYGSLRNVWEGTYIGEGILSVIKPLITDLRKNWHINAGRRYNRMKSINKILNQYSSKNKLPQLTDREYCTYINDQHARDLFNDEKPLSLLCLNNGEFVLVLSRNQFIKVERKHFYETKFGMSYFKWQMMDSISENVFTFDQVKHYCLILPYLLPLKRKQALNYGIYCLITSEWLEMNANGDINISKISDTEYSSVADMDYDEYLV